MDAEIELVAQVIEVLESLQISYIVGGSFALCVWAAPRTTHDLDLVVELPLSRVPEFCARFPTERYYIDAEAMRDGLGQGFYSFIDMVSGMKVDLFPLQPSDAVQVGAFSRRVHQQLLTGRVAAVYTAEDLLVQKLRWHVLGESERQFRDCLELMLADLAREPKLIDQGRVEATTRRLGTQVHAAWRLLQAAVEQTRGTG